MLGFQLQYMSHSFDLSLDLYAAASVAVLTPDTCIGLLSVAGLTLGQSASRETTMAKTKTKSPQKTKIAILRDLLQSPKGARLEDLCKATGWQAHTVRAAMSRLRKTGVMIDRQRNEAGQSVYRISGQEEAGQ